MNRGVTIVLPMNTDQTWNLSKSIVWGSRCKFCVH